MITSLGSLSIGVAVPAASDVNAALLVTANIAAPNVSAQITALASFTPSVTVSFADLLAMANEIIANINAAIAAIPPIPVISLSAQVALAAAILVDLNAALAIIDANIALQATIAGLLATGSVQAYIFDGANNAFGGELATALGGATTHTNAIVLLTTSGASWTAMQAFFKTM